MYVFKYLSVCARTCVLNQELHIECMLKVNKAAFWLQSSEWVLMETNGMITDSYWSCWTFLGNGKPDTKIEIKQIISGAGAGLGL